MILRLPQGYETPLAAGGVGLSGGQRQRIGLARALYGDPALIVLDEPNSNLDDAGEVALQKALQELRQMGRTVVVMAHRPAVVRAADKLLLLADGAMVAFGPRGQILERLAGARAAAQLRPVPAAMERA
jgi:ATP-binding cassette subfamily C exporter for protease/lipase